MEIIILSEVSQTEKGQYHMILLISGILKDGTNKLIWNKLTDGEKELMMTREEVGEEIDWGFGTDVHVAIFKIDSQQWSTI